MVAWKSVGRSRYKGDTNGVEQFLTENAANRVLDLIELVSREPGCRRLTVNEGCRTRPRQLDLWNRWKAGKGYLAAVPYTSRHDEVKHGNAADLGGPDGEALNAAERSAIVRIGPTIGVEFTGLEFEPPEPWHVEAAEHHYQRRQSTADAAPTLTPQGDEMIHLLGSKRRGEALLGPGYAHSINTEEAALVGELIDKTIDCRNNDRKFDVIWAMSTQARPRN
jgi:hypothetical protein